LPSTYRGWSILHRSVAELTADHATDPLGIAGVPALAWRLAGPGAAVQTAYQILVARDRVRLTEGRADVWDSGRVAGTEQTGVAYGGPPLAARNRYHWAVRIWDERGEPTPFSAPAWFETDLGGDWAGAAWIAGAPGPVAPLLRRTFELTAPTAKARLYLCGLGYAVAAMNGDRIGDAVLDPPFTAYHRRALYRTYDVGAHLHQGANVLAVELARGWYGLNRAATIYFDKAPWLGDPRLLARLVVEHPDGATTEVSSDAHWLTHPGPTIVESVYAGETYDARRELPGWDRPGFDDTGWVPARPVPAPCDHIESTLLEPIRVVDTVCAESVSEPQPGTYMHTLPLMAVGWVRISAEGPAGTMVTVRYAETLRPDGSADVTGDPGLTVGDIQTDTFVLAGTGRPEAFEPRFSYKGFQFVQIDGVAPTSVQARIAHTDVTSLGEFECSDPLASTLHQMARRSIRYNLHGMPTDTPTFEKRGWLGDAQLTAESALDNFDMWQVYAKWLRDIADSQAADGNVSGLVPTPFPGDCPDPAWGTAYVTIPWLTYWHYGDPGLLSEHYDGMRRYVSYLTASALDGLVPPALFGDWLPPGTGAWGEIPGSDHFFPPEGPDLCAAAYHYRAVTTLAAAAQVLGHLADADADEDLAARLRGAFHARFFDADAGCYGTGRGGYRQTSQVLPLAFGLVPAKHANRVVAGLVADIGAKGDHLDTGILGTKELWEVLTAHGHADLAYALLTQRTHPGFGDWVDQGATTLWEAWEQPRSRNHHMYGSYDAWLYSTVAGIAATAPGYARLRVQPTLCDGLSWANASIDTVRGRVASSWTLSADGRFDLQVTIPPNAQADIVLPTGQRHQAGPGEHHFRTERAYRP